MLYRLIYTSAATHDFSAEKLGELIATCRANNARDEVTGLLIYHEGGFLQVLEGSQPVLEACYGRIQADRRHSSCIRLMFEPTASRIFADWTMSCMDFAELTSAQRRQFVDLRKTAAAARKGLLDEHPAVKVFLLAFLAPFRELDAA